MVQQEFFNPEEKKQENISTAQRDASGQLRTRSESGGHFDEYEDMDEDETEFDEGSGLDVSEPTESGVPTTVRMVEVVD